MMPIDAEREITLVQTPAEDEVFSERKRKTMKMRNVGLDGAKK